MINLLKAFYLEAIDKPQQAKESYYRCIIKKTYLPIALLGYARCSVVLKENKNLKKFLQEYRNAGKINSFLLLKIFADCHNLLGDKSQAISLYIEMYQKKIKLHQKLILQIFSLLQFIVFYLKKMLKIL